MIKGQLRGYDFLVRYGGGEFVALVPDTSPTDVMDICEHIEKAVTSFQLKSGENEGASVGVSTGACGWSGQTLDQCIVSAEKAMYVWKGRRKGSRGHVAAAAAAAAGSPGSLIEPVPVPLTHTSLNDNLYCRARREHVVSRVQ